MGWNERSDPDMRTANFCDVYREGVYTASYIWLQSVYINYRASSKFLSQALCLCAGDSCYSSSVQKSISLSANWP